MGLIQSITGLIFGNGRNVVADTVEVFRENSEAGAQRVSDERMAAMAQFASEFAHARQSRFDRLVDAMNRLPRPLLALGTLGLFVAAMVDPLWFADRMVGIALIPEPLWWLMGAIVSFYFGARYQAKGQEFQRSVAETLVLGKAIREDAAQSDQPHVQERVERKTAESDRTGQGRAETSENPYPHNAALAEWWSIRHAA